MSLIKFNRNRSPWATNSVANWIDTENFFTDDFFTKRLEHPPMNVKENEDNFEIELAVPGFSKKDIEITMDNDILCIHGNNSHEEETKDDNYTRKDFSCSSFERKLQLPQTVDQNEEIQARYANGVLKLELYKKAKVIQLPKKSIAIH